MKKQAQSRDVTCLKPRGYPEEKMGFARRSVLTPEPVPFLLLALPRMRTPRLAVVASRVPGQGPPFPHLGAPAPPAPSHSRWPCASSVPEPLGDPGPCSLLCSERSR